MVTTAAPATITTPQAPARAISATMAGATDPSGVNAGGPFDSLLNQLDASAGPPAAALNPATISTPIPTSPVVVTQTPGQQLPAPTLSGPATPSSDQAKSAKSSADTKNADTKTADAPRGKAPADEPPGSDDRLPTPTPQLAQLLPVTPSQPTSIALAPPAAPSAAVDPSVAGSTTATTDASPPVDGLPSPPNSPADKPGNAILGAQAAVSPSLARSLARGIVDDDDGATVRAPSKALTDETDQAVPDRSGLSSGAAPPSTTVVNPIVALPTIVPATPLASSAPASGVAQAVSPRSTPTGQPSHTTRTTSENADSAPLPPPATATPEIVASTVQPGPAIATAASIGTASVPAPSPSAPLARADPPTSQPNSPASQVAQAIVEPVKIMMSSPAQVAAAASHVTTIQITPVELGRVDIRIERLDDGPAKIQLVAERPETLSRLVHDQSQLHQALDQAGIPQAGRMLDFSLAPIPTPEFSASSFFAGGTANGGSFSGNEQQRSNGTYANRGVGATAETGSDPIPHLRSARAGIDITA